MADPNLLAAILSGQDPLAPQMLQGYQGAQLSSAALNPEFGHNEGIAGALAKTLAGFSGNPMTNQAVQNTTQARIAAQPELARLLANQNPYGELGQNPQLYSPVTRAAFLAGGPEQAQRYQLGQQAVTGEALKNLAALSQARLQAASLGGQMPTSQSIRSGAYQGPDWSKALGAAGPLPSVGATVGQGNAGDPRGLTPFIQQTAAKYGIDPAIAVKVAASEGLGAPAGPSGDGGTSGNAFQLHVTPGGKGNAVGDQFMAETGLNPLDPANERATIDFALRHASQNGWGAWSGATKAGIEPFQGIGARTQVAQNAGPTATDAGAASGIAMSPTEAYKQQALLNAFGIKVPEPLQDYLAAMTVPPGPGRDVALSAAYNKGGIKPFIGGERRGSPIFKFNPQTGSYDLSVQNPQLPEGAIESPTGDISMARGALPAIAGVAGAQAAGRATMEPQTGVVPEGQPGAGIPYVIPRSQALAPGAPPLVTGLSPGAKETQEKGAEYQAKFGDMLVGGAAPGGGRATAQQPMTGTRLGIDPTSGKAFTSIIPSASAQQLPQSPAEAEAMQKPWQDRKDEFADAVDPAQQAEERLSAQASIYKIIETGAWKEQKAAVAAKLKTLGVDISKINMDDPAGVETALHENYQGTLNYLKTVNNRFTQREFSTLSEYNPRPGLQPTTNLQLLSESIGILRRDQALAKDWEVAQKNGWRNPVSFEAQYMTANPLGPIVNAVAHEIGPLKGMAPGATAAGAPYSPIGAAPPTPTAQTRPPMPKPGDLMGGHIFKGGDPSDRNNWAIAPQGAAPTR